MPKSYDGVAARAYRETVARMAEFHDMWDTPQLRQRRADFEMEMDPDVQAAREAKAEVSAAYEAALVGMVGRWE